MLPAEVHILNDESPAFQAFTKFVRLTVRKRELADETKEVEKQLRALEPSLLSYLGEGGYEKVKVEGYTLSPHREPWVYPAEHATKDTVIAALKACGLGHYVHEDYSTRSLTKYVRDLEEAAGTIENTLAILPVELASVIKIEPSFRVNVLKTWR
jgi:hypothetical protein